MRVSIIFTLLIFAGTALKGQMIDEIGVITDTIPFRLTPYNNISIEAVVNGRDTVQLMFHTAAESVGLIEEAVNRLSGDEKFGDSTDVTSWGGKGSMRYAKDNTLSIGELHWDSLTIFESKYSGRETDGKFGPILFGDRIIEIDFEDTRIVIHDKLPVLGEEFSAFEVTRDRVGSHLRLELLLEDSSFVNTFMIHSGYSGTILVDDEFTARHQLGAKLKTVSESELKDSQGNVLVSKKAILPGLKFQSAVLHDLPIAFFTGTIGRQKVSVMGGDLLRRFHIFWDRKENTMYLKPNELWNTSFWEG